MVFGPIPTLGTALPGGKPAFGADKPPPSNPGIGVMSADTADTMLLASPVPPAITLVFECGGAFLFAGLLIPRVARFLLFSTLAASKILLAVIVVGKAITRADVEMPNVSSERSCPMPSPAVALSIA